VHSVEQSFRAYDMARAAGLENINIDLIYASPGHDPRAWRRDLETVLNLEPEHLSAYNLAFEEETPFSRWLHSGKLEALPEETELELFEITRELTARHGLGQYEISNYARAGRACEGSRPRKLERERAGRGGTIHRFPSRTNSSNKVCSNSRRTAIA